MLPNNKNWFNSVPTWNSALFLFLVKKLQSMRQHGETIPGVCAEKPPIYYVHFFSSEEEAPYEVDKIYSPCGWTISQLFQKCYLGPPPSASGISSSQRWGSGKVKVPVPSSQSSADYTGKLTDTKSSPAFCISLTIICNFHLWCWLPKHSKYFLALYLSTILNPSNLNLSQTTLYVYTHTYDCF